MRCHFIDSLYALNKLLTINSYLRIRYFLDYPNRKKLLFIDKSKQII